MREQPMNPYESPVIPNESPTLPEPRGVIVRFAMDERNQWIAASNFNDSIPAWVYWTLPLGVIAVGAVVLTAAINFGSLGGLGSLFMMFLMLTAVGTWRHRRVIRRELARMQQHPVLGVVGDWKLTASHDELIVETPGGTQSFSRATTPIQMLEGADLVIWFDGNFPVTIPERGQYAKMCRVLRYWFIKTATPPEPIS
jgi:hypothetical protein